MQMLLVFLMSAVAVCVVDVLQVLLTCSCSVAVYADTTCVVGMCCSTIVGHR